MTRRASYAVFAQLALCWGVGLAAQTPQPGTTLYAPLASTTTYAVDVSGIAQHMWTSTFVPGVAVYLRDNGNIVRTKRTAAGPGGVGGGLQEFTYDGTLVWDWSYDGAMGLSHHDIALLPNGNVLVLAWDEHSVADAIANGRNPATVSGCFTPDHIIEARPTGPTTADIVWEWYAFDHLVQEFDPAAANFGVVADHPELIDINFPPGSAVPSDWLHSNGLDYNAELDQIAISVLHFDELWVIDHSTTTAEAAGHVGGTSGMGGDLLYRWGNPQAYGRGTAADQVLDAQHDANWVAPGHPGNGNLIVLNNLAGPNFSQVLEIEPPLDANGNYSLASGQTYGPALAVWDYTAPNPPDFFTPIVGGAVRLANGNTLITEGLTGRVFEVDTFGTTVWTHQNLEPGAIFKARRYDHFLWATGDSASLSAGGTVPLHLHAGSDQAGRFYWVLGSASGTTPGLNFAGLTLPLNPADPYFRFTLTNPSFGPLSTAFGVLDGQGRGTSQFVVAQGTNPALAGLELHHAFAVLTPGTAHLTSNALQLNLLP